MQSILLGIIAVIVPAVAAYLAIQIAKLNGAIDSWPGVFKQVLAVVVAFAFSFLGGLFGVQFPVDLAGLADPVVLQGVLAGVLSWLVHRIFRPAA